MAPFTQQKKLLFLKAQMSKRKRQVMQNMLITLNNQRRIRLFRTIFVLQLILTALQNAAATLPRPRLRSCRRFQRNTGWWNMVWKTYSEKRFKKTFRMTRATFSLIHDRYNKIIKQNITEQSIPSELRLAICLYRLSRGDYYSTISELTCVGEAIVCIIVREVAKAIVKNLWGEFVESKFPNDEDSASENARNGARMAISICIFSDRWLSYTNQVPLRWSRSLQRVS